MHCTVEEVAPLRRRLELRVESAELAEREASLLQKYSRQAKLKGFRPGRVPAALMRKRFGRHVHTEATEALIREGLQKGVEEHGLRPLGPFEQEKSEDDDGIVHVVAFDIQPDIQLPAPADLSLGETDTEVTDQEVDDYLLDIRKRAGDLMELEAGDTLRPDDIVTLSGEIRAGDESVREVHDLRHILGAYPLFGKTPEEMVAACAELGPESELAFDTTLPPDFQPPEWAGKDAHVSLGIQTAQRRTPAEITGEFLAQVGVADEEALTTRIREVLGQRKEQEVTQQHQIELIEALEAKTDFALPENLFASALEQQLEQRRRMARMQAGDDEPEPVDEDAVRQEVERDLRHSLLLEAVATTYEVQVEQRDIEQQIALAAYQNGRKFEDVAKELQESGRLPDVIQEIRHGKAISLLLDRIRSEGERGPTEPAREASDKTDAATAPTSTASTPTKKKTAKKKTAKKQQPDRPSDDEGS